MKATLTFSLPDDRYELASAIRGPRYRNILVEYREWLRSSIKYATEENPVPCLEEARAVFLEMVDGALDDEE